jgi:hypothetical protein
VILAILCVAGAARADEPVAKWSTDDRPHAGMPFELRLLVGGLDEHPQPDPPKLTIPGATVKWIGAQPNVSRSIQIINGRRSDSTTVTWVLQWSVTVAKEGHLRVPSVTVVQGSKRATAQAADADVDAIPVTDAMRLELSLPERPVFVGENIPVTLTWLFRADPQRDPQFQVPMLEGDSFTIGTPPQTTQRTYKFAAGDKVLDLPYKVDETDVGGVRHHRLVATFYAAPKKTGKIDVPPASVVVALPVGRADFFGSAPSRLFRATDLPHTIEVKPLPETDRPPGFAGAVGTQFSMAVATSRSVVQLGEPVELAITVKSDQRLDTLALGKLDGLPKDRFTVPAEQPTGELSNDGKTKTFKVTAQVTGPANEIPALAFSYFDPVKGTYQTVHSDPIALSVKGGAIVGANDVVAATPTKKQVPADTDLALVGADLALSAPGETGDTPLGGALLWLIVGVLYALPLALLAARTWQLRTRGQREEAAEVRAARRHVEQELARAAKLPARETAGPLASALRAYARVLDRNSATLRVAARPGEAGAFDREANDAVLARIETESFAPDAAASPLSAELRARVEELVRGWTAPRKSAGKAAAIVALVLVGIAGDARAEALADGRAAYQDALAKPDATSKRAAFTRAAALLGDAARAEPGHPELLADWGNAALGAGDVATATLAYRRALALDGGNARATRNLAWLRSREPDTLRPAGDSAANALFFFHHWPRARRLVVAGVAFALAVLLVVPWADRRRRVLVGLTLVPLAIWLAMLASLVLEDRHADDAVVMDGVVLRAADSAGAPAAMGEPLPRGAEVTVLERRDAWTRIRIANGTAGWVQAGSIEPVGR